MASSNKPSNDNDKPQKEGSFYWDLETTKTFVELLIAYSDSVMAVCDFDLNFTFISAGWEGSAHDARVFDHALSTEALRFPHPPPGRYYVCDKGYPDREGYLVPYPKTKYHRPTFVGEPPTNEKESFNKLQSSLRGAVERIFGIFKGQWKIARGMPSYPVKKQVDIMTACFALHNFIRQENQADMQDDPRFMEGDGIQPDPMDEDDDAYDDGGQPVNNVDDPLYVPDDDDEAPIGMRALRDHIAHQIWNDRRGRR